MCHGISAFKKIQTAANCIVRINKTVLQMARDIKRRNAALTLQAAGKRYLAIRELNQIREASIIVQCRARTIKERIPHVKNLSAKRVREKIERELREKEEKASGVPSTPTSASGSDPYAIAVRRSARKRNSNVPGSDASQDQTPNANSSNNSTPIQQPQPQHEVVVEAVRKQQQEGESRISGLLATAVNESLEARLGTISQRLDLLPTIDRNVSSILSRIESSPLPTPSLSTELVGDTQTPAENSEAPTDKSNQNPDDKNQSNIPETVQTEAPPLNRSKVTPLVATAPSGAPQLTMDEGALLTLFESVVGQSSLMRSISMLQSMLAQNTTLIGQQGVLVEELTSSKSSETSQYIEALHKLRTEHSGMQSMLVSARVEIEVKAAENAGLEQQIKELRQNIVELKSTSQKLQDENDALAKASLEASERERLATLKLEEASRDRDDAKRQVADLADQLTELKHSVKELITIRKRNAERQTSGASSLASAVGGALASPLDRAGGGGRVRSSTFSSSRVRADLIERRRVSGSLLNRIVTPTKDEVEFAPDTFATPERISLKSPKTPQLASEDSSKLGLDQK
eukprot:c20329_g1_i2.p1 GENE.c20329_g1_i2~~c20329_g1_i2.p1  ORF type:complete len:576 (+),score=166.73 c20329_g1_i2:638-2365(+)